MYHSTVLIDEAPPELRSRLWDLERDYLHDLTMFKDMIDNRRARYQRDVQAVLDNYKMKEAINVQNKQAV